VTPSAAGWPICFPSDTVHDFSIDLSIIVVYKQARNPTTTRATTDNIGSNSCLSVPPSDGAHPFFIRSPVSISDMLSLTTTARLVRSQARGVSAGFCSMNAPAAMAPAGHVILNSHTMSDKPRTYSLVRKVELPAFEKSWS
jgi:hypothetical protein